mgnify:CR=1 FL=1
MTGHLYSVAFASAESSAVDKDIFMITASTKSNFRVRELVLAKLGAALSATAQEILSVLIRRGSSVASAGGATAVPRNLDARSDSTATFTTLVNSSTPGSSTGEIIYSGSWNTLERFVWRPPKNESPVCILSQRLQVRLGTPAAAINLVGTMIVEEIGKAPGSAVQ